MSKRAKSLLIKEKMFSKLTGLRPKKNIFWAKKWYLKIINFFFEISMGENICE